MLRLDNNLLEELGLGALPEDQKRQMLQHIYETLELRVGTHLANQMTDKQLEEFEKFIDAGGDANQAQALQWLEANLPNYKQVVNDTFEALKAEVKQMAPQLLSAAAAQPQPQAPQMAAQPPVTPQQPIMPPPPQPQPIPTVEPPMQPQTPPMPLSAPQAPPMQPPVSSSPSVGTSPSSLPPQPFAAPQPAQAPQPWQPAPPSQSAPVVPQPNPVPPVGDTPQASLPQTDTFGVAQSSAVPAPQPWQPAPPPSLSNPVSDQPTLDNAVPPTEIEPPKSDWQPSPTHYQNPPQSQ